MTETIIFLIALAAVLVLGLYFYFEHKAYEETKARLEARRLEKENRLKEVWRE